MRKILPLLISSFLLISCSNNNIVIDSKVFCFDTVIETKSYDSFNIDDVEDIYRLYDKLSDNYDERDIFNVYSINHTNEEVEVSEKLYNLLKTSFNVDEAKYFNPLCGSLAKSWKESLSNGEILDETTISEELEKISYSSLIFKDNNVIQRNGEAEIDLGGIAKGYTLDLVYDYLKENEVSHYFVNGGSSSILLGEKPNDDGYFTVGLNDLKGAYLKLKNCFVSTSSKSVQGVEIDGIIYSHIINPITGSAINNFDAVVVISNKGYLGDALSTSLMMSTLDEIKEIENECNVMTLVIKDDKLVYSHPDLEVTYQ